MSSFFRFLRHFLNRPPPLVSQRQNMSTFYFAHVPKILNTKAKKSDFKLYDILPTSEFYDSKMQYLPITLQKSYMKKKKAK